VNDNALAANCGCTPVVTEIELDRAARTMMVPAPELDVTIAACVIVLEPDVHAANCSRLALLTVLPETVKSEALVSTTRA